MKKITVLMLSLVMILSAFSSFTFADSYDVLTEDQKANLINLGYPSTYKGSMQKWYENIQDEIGDPFAYGSFTHYGVMCNFVSSMKKTTDPSSLSDFEYVARGAFDEAANESGQRVESLEAVWDCLTNRVKGYNHIWSNYRIAGEKWGLNSINPKYSQYWKGQNVIRPLESASFSNEARITLIKSYMIAFNKFQQGANPPSPHYKLTDLPDEYTFFNKEKLEHSIKKGAFWFHRHEDKM